MLKLIYPLWKKTGPESNGFREQLLHTLAPELSAVGAVGRFTIAVVDSDVAVAAPRRMETLQALPDALVSVYLDSPELEPGDMKQVIDPVLTAGVARSQCLLVKEAEPLRNLAHPVDWGKRVYGFCQVVFLQRPGRLDSSRWLDLWQGQHTQVAIDTQATFAYRQNLVLQQFGEDAPVLHAVIEENFPPEAMTSDLAFYGVTGKAELQANQAAMIESCARFIDFDKIDVIPMSEYDFRA